MIQFTLLTTPFNKFSLKNILEWILVLNQDLEHVNNVLGKVNNTIGLIPKLQDFYRTNLYLRYKNHL